MRYLVNIIFIDISCSNIKLVDFTVCTLLQKAIIDNSQKILVNQNVIVEIVLFTQ